MTRIDAATLRATAELAHLDLADADAARLLARLQAVLDHFAALAGVDTTGVEASPYPLQRALQPRFGPPELPSGHLEQADVLANAPASRDGSFVVPRMIER